MKKIKKCMALILAMMMALAMSMTAFAEEEGAVEKEAAQEAAVQTGSLTVNGSANSSLEGKQVFIFKLFEYSKPADNTTADDTYTLNPVYRNTLAGLLKLKPDATDYTIYSALVDLKGDDIQKFANDFTKEIKGLTLEEGKDYYSSGKITAESYTFTNIQQGYYLMYLGGTTEIMSSLVFVDKENESATLKATTPVPEKEAYGSDNKPIESVQIGDVIKYEVKMSIPDASAYNPDTYVFKLKDTLSDGLDFVNDDGTLAVDKLTVTIDVDGTSKSGDAVVEGKIMTLDLSQEVLENQEKKEITVSYYAKVNEKADISNTKNEAKLEYSNDPMTGGTGESIPDIEKTPTFVLNVHKFEKNKETEYLAGAEFTLSMNENGTNPIKVKADGEGIYVVAADQNDPNATDKMVTVAKEAAKGSNLQIKGLKAGTYFLTETKAPVGFSEAPVIKIIIKESKTENIEDYTVSVEKDGTVAPEKDKIIDIENRKNGDLPETGGVGTVLFTLGGAILLAGIVISFIVSRKRNAE